MQTSRAERTYLNVGALGFRTARRTKLPGNLPQYVHCSWQGTAVIHTKHWMLWSESHIY